MDMHLNCRYCWHCRPQIWIKEASLQLRQELGWKHCHVSLWLCCLPWVCPTIYVDHFLGCCSLKKLVCMDVVNIISSMSITIVGSLASKLELTSTSKHAHDTFKNLAVYVELIRKPLQCVCGLLHGRCLWYFSFMGFYPVDLEAVGLQLAAVALAATLVESLPITNRLDDNLTVPLTTIILGLFLFPVKSTMTPLP